MSHCASSYAAILSLAMVGGDAALNLVDRKMLYANAYLLARLLATNIVLSAGGGLDRSSSEMAASKYV